jgi:ERCC4-type nuclease
MYALAIDDRERAVIPYFDAIDQADCNVHVDRIQVGDYAVFCNEQLIMCIERKTWSDLAASIRDGRKNNVLKMIDARTRTNCRIIYLIEGPGRHKPSTKIGRIPFKSLQAHLDHLMLRDNVHIVFAANLRDVADRIMELIRGHRVVAVAAGVVAAADGHQSTDIAIGGADMEMLKKIVPKPGLSIEYDIWRTLPFVTDKTATVLMDAGHHIRDFVLGHVDKDAIYGLRYTTGGIIGKRAAKIISGAAVATAKPDLFIKIVAAVPGVSKATAAVILAERPITSIMTDISEKDLSNIKLNERRRIGQAAATNIIKYLRPQKK